jgi:hypothetical protein
MPRMCPYQCGRECHKQHFCCPGCFTRLSKPDRDTMYALYRLWQRKEITVEEMHRRQEAALIPKTPGV